MKQHTFTLSNSGKEFPAHFGGQEMTYSYPENMTEVLDLLPEKVSAEEKQALAEAFEKAPLAAAILYGKVMGQGIHLDIQKAGKDKLGAEEGEKDARRYVHAKTDVAKATEIMGAAFSEYRIPEPGTARGQGQGTKLARTEAAKVKAETERDVARANLATAYRMIPKNARGEYGAKLVAEGVFTQEELDAL